MSKKILISLSVIGAVAALAIGGTIAYFSDTETSTGNTFSAGKLDLTVWSEGHATGSTCTLVKEVNSDGAIFNCTDVKPGDSGESTVHFKLDSNPAWGCVLMSGLTQTEGECTEPEKAIEGDNCGDTGELGKHLQFKVWLDDGVGETHTGKCNNQLDNGEFVLTRDSSGNPIYVTLDALLARGEANAIMPISTPGADSWMGKGNPIPAGEHCLGIAWQVPPSPTDNEYQDDGVGPATVQFYVEQSRNNNNFTCQEKLQLPRINND